MLSSFISPAQLKARLPASGHISQFIHQSRQTIKHLLQGKLPKIAFVIGPCSVHHREGILSYAQKIKELSLNDNIFIVMRAYMEKSRTQRGWKGLVYDPLLDGSYHLEAGLHLARELLLQLSALEIPLAVEIVDPTIFSYYDDLVTWGFVGARTVSSQVHRQYVSTLPFPVGFKNAVDGDTLSALQSIESARHPHYFLTPNSDGQTSLVHSKGNPFTHLVLRGSAHGPNYSMTNEILKQQLSHEIHSRILVDCAHGNSGKVAENQLTCFYHTLDQILQGNSHLLGMMLESYTKWGKQSLPSNAVDADISVTDPCIDFATTEKLLLTASEELKNFGGNLTTITG